MSLIENALQEAYGNTLPKIRPCPFCGGKAQISYRDVKFGGQNYLGDRKVKYRVQVICSRCKSRGKPITTDYLINPNPYVGRKQRPFEPYNIQAIEAWNNRKDDDKK